MKNGLCIAVLLMSAGIAVAQEPPVDVSGKLVPNIKSAQGLLRQAYDKILAAQKSNEWDMKGHAQRAKQLIEQADSELKLAEEASIRSRLDSDIQYQR